MPSSEHRQKSRDGGAGQAQNGHRIDSQKHDEPAQGGQRELFEPCHIGELPVVLIQRAQKHAHEHPEQISRAKNNP